MVELSKFSKVPVELNPGIFSDLLPVTDQLLLLLPLILSEGVFFDPEAVEPELVQLVSSLD